MPWSVYNSNGKLLQSLAIADDSIVEGKLDVSNAPTNGQFLQAQSGEGGGLTWAAVTAPTEATQANMEAEATGSLFVPPDLVKNSPGVAKAWAIWEMTGSHGYEGGTTEGTHEWNFDSVTDGGDTGETDHILTTDFSTAYYSIIATVETQTNGAYMYVTTTPAQAAGTFTTVCREHDGTRIDTIAFVACFGKQA